MRFDADGEDFNNLNDSSNSPDFTGDVTAMCWARVVVDRNTYSSAFAFDVGSSSEYCYFQTGNNGTTWEFDSEESGYQSTSVRNASPSVGGWIFLAMAYDQSAATIAVYSRLPTETSLVLEGTQTSRNFDSAHDTSRVGDSPYSNEWLNGEVTAYKVWERLMTSAEILQESYFVLPVSKQNMFRAHPLVVEGAQDYTGNGHTFNGGSGAVQGAEHPPGVAWGQDDASGLFVPVDLSAAELEQEGFRWRDDDDDEANATWLASQDTNGLSVAIETTRRLRATIDASGDPTAKGFKLQYRKSGASRWDDVSE